MTNKKKILIINASSSYGGVSALLYNYYIHMNKSNLSFDFLSPRKSSFEIKRNEIEANNDNIYNLNIKKRGIMFYHELHYKMKLFLKNKQYNVIHINSGIILYNAITSYVAKKYSKSKIIVHSHSAYKKKGFKKIICFFLKEIIKKNSDYYFSCSIEAAKEMFPKRIIKQNLYKIINNGINPDEYLFNKNARKSIRKNLKISDDCIVLGNVARLTEVKNQFFLIELIETLKHDLKKFKLIIVGDGELRNQLEKTVKEKQLTKYVIFTGLKENVNDYYSAMDIFLLPSFSEGFGLTVLEAQTNGLYCIISDGVPNSVKVTNLVFRETLNINIWKDKVLYLSNKMQYSRKEFVDVIKKSKYNILTENKKLEKIYLSISDKEEK